MKLNIYLTNKYEFYTIFNYYVVFSHLLNISHIKLELWYISVE